MSLLNNNIKEQLKAEAEGCQKKNRKKSPGRELINERKSETENTGELLVQALADSFPAVLSRKQDAINKKKDAIDFSLLLHRLLFLSLTLFLAPLDSPGTILLSRFSL